jgi:hypothetical protein
MGQEAVDGTFTFAVRLVTTHKKDVLTERIAQGVFVDLVMYVKNVGRSSQSYSAEYQRLLDSEGREYSPDLSAITQRYGPNGWGIHIDINPGNTATAGLIFDVPEGTQPSQYVLLLRSSLDSRGATANLT